MPLSGQEVAVERVGRDEWCVSFTTLVLPERTWEFEAYKTGESRADGVNLFWSEAERAFVGNSRRDVPPPVLERTVEWILHIASCPT